MCEGGGSERGGGGVYRKCSSHAEEEGGGGLIKVVLTWGLEVLVMVKRHEKFQTCHFPIL